MLFVALLTASTNLSPVQILKKSIDVSTPSTMVSTTRQIVHTYTGKKREFLVKSYSKNGNDKMLFVYLKPARVKGDKFLFLKGGDIYAYFSKTGRVRRIASSAKKAKMHGSDFSYEDVQIMSELDKNFNPKLLHQEKYDDRTCYVLELKPKKGVSFSYEKLLAWIDTENFTTLRVDFYRKGKVIKRMVQKDFKKIKGVWVPLKMEMTSLKNNTKTETIVDEVEVNVDVPDRFFTLGYLKRGG